MRARRNARLRGRTNARGRNYCRKISISNIENGRQIFSLRVAAAAFISVTARTVISLRVPFSMLPIRRRRHSVLLWSTWSKSLRRFFSRASYWNSGGKNYSGSTLPSRGTEIHVKLPNSSHPKLFDRRKNGEKREDVSLFPISSRDCIW